ncbi:phosphorylase family protein [Streptomyces smyrnaeus]|uniref:phosphorylase family protein n=1 Tax=Streptomyces smyrnaeus TaxID=1387713 RepID=UPI001FD7BAF0|nr:hypothetical protein [Streptomyces smyrnaeus]
MSVNRGIVSRGNNNVFTNNAIGEHAQVAAGAPSHGPGTRPAESGGEAAPAPWDIGVVAILSEELRAVVDELKLERHRVPDGLFFYQGRCATPDADIRVVATQSQSQGQRSAMAAFENLRRHYSPRLWALVGVGGGIHKGHACIGNVIVATDIVYYENRKLNPGGDVRRRGEHRQAPAPVVHGVNAYFADRGTPARINGQALSHASKSTRSIPESSDRARP